jgi:hypothetical protein
MPRGDAARDVDGESLILLCVDARASSEGRRVPASNDGREKSFEVLRGVEPSGKWEAEEEDRPRAGVTLRGFEEGDMARRGVTARSAAVGVRGRALELEAALAMLPRFLEALGGVGVVGDDRWSRGRCVGVSTGDVGGDMVRRGGLEGMATVGYNGGGFPRLVLVAVVVVGSATRGGSGERAAVRGRSTEDRAGSR